jgi:hypothetical protein
MRDRVLTAAQQAGREPEEITCAYTMEIRIDERSEQPPSVVAGSPEAVTERLLSFAKLGFTAMNFTPVGPGEGEHRSSASRDRCFRWSAARRRDQVARLPGASLQAAS